MTNMVLDFAPTRIWGYLLIEATNTVTINIPNVIVWNVPG